MRCRFGANPVASTREISHHCSPSLNCTPGLEGDTRPVGHAGRLPLPGDAIGAAVLITLVALALWALRSEQPRTDAV